ncbi:MAG: hypothetical protein ACW9W4_07795 [Candidatus Nitrosopumilus sp. bin_7KS]
MDVQKRICKNICKKFIVKKPTSGSRYGVGQGRCQTCEVWIDYRGAHIKDGSKASKDTLSWFCNCCNYRIRQKPRNKVYKEKLSVEMKIKKEGIESINQKPCPKCSIKPTKDNIESIFGMRMSNGKSIRQSYCRNCRISNSLKDRDNEILEFILLNAPANPYDITKNFQRINLAQLEREEKIQWDKTGKGWILTPNTRKQIKKYID